MDRREAELRLGQLRQELQRHNRLYYVQAAPEIGDQAYDALYRELLEVEGTFPDLVTPDSPSQRVGAEPLTAFQAQPHAVPMLSLDNTYDDDELRRFHDYVLRGLGASEPAYIIEPKVDGVSISLRYEDGILVQALTRGNGVQGDEVTANVRTIPSVPLRLDTDSPPAVFEARGEVFMSKEGFSSLNAHRLASGEAEFANARNATAGTLKQLDSRAVAQRPLEIVCYAEGEVRGVEIHSQTELLAALRRFGFRTQPWSPQVRGLEAMLAAIRELGDTRHDFPYDIDGAVIKVDDFAQREKLGFTSKAPSWAKAFKYQPDQARTVLHAITVQVGRTGVLTPVAELEPVFLAGSTIARATLHNEDEIRRKDIRVGDTVVIQKAGEVIPEVVETVPECRQEKSEPFDLVQHVGGVCPSCGGPIERDPEFVAYRCPNLQCPAQSVRRLQHFASRNAMDIEALGGIVAEKLVERGLVAEPLDLFSLAVPLLAGLNLGTESEPRVLGPKNATKLIEAVNRARDLPLARWLHAIGIPQVGASVSRHLANCHADLAAVAESDLLRSLVELFELQDSLRDLNPNAVRNRKRASGEKQDLARQLAEVETKITAQGDQLAAIGLVRPSEAKTGGYVTTDIGPKTAQSILAFFASAAGQALCERLVKIGIEPKGRAPETAPAQAASLSGLTFVLTGTLQTMDRGEAKERIEALGGRAAGSVSRNTSFLVAGANTGASKTRKAADLGVEVIDEQRLLTMLAGEPAPAAPATAAEPPAPAPAKGEDDDEAAHGALFDWAKDNKRP